MKKLLHIVPYQHLYPPMNGGMLRNYFLCYELSKYFQVTLLTFQPEAEFVDGVQGYGWNKDIRVISLPLPKPGQGLISKLRNAMKGRWYQKNLFRSAGSYMMEGYPVMRRMLRSESFDFVLFEHLFSLELQPLVRRLCPGARILFDAHNVDHLLYAQENDISIPAHRRAYEEIRVQETMLYAKADLFLACSEKDRNTLEQLNKGQIRGYVVPNGADTYRNRFREAGVTAKNILFCGSLDYEPNRDGILWFYNSIWPVLKAAYPDLGLTIIGRNGTHEDYAALKQDKDIQFVGEVPDVRPYYANSYLSVVPLRKGSGTRLKILEAMSLGTTVVSTGIGAEGIDCTHGEHLYIADTREDFIGRVKDLLDNPNQAELLRINARKLIDTRYSWQVVVAAFADQIQTNNHTRTVTL
jgi:glycosyltransferase involved in cell wall biosynthesis